MASEYKNINFLMFNLSFKVDLMKIYNFKTKIKSHSSNYISQIKQISN